jgi:ABC-type multidrug transport system ATPase subunit
MIEIKDLFLQKKIPEISELTLRVEPGEVYVLLSSGGNVTGHLINIFNGVEDTFRGTVSVDGRDLSDSSNEEQDNLVFIDRGSEWPPVVRIGHLVTFLRRVRDIPEDDFEEFKLKLNIDRLATSRIGELGEVERRRFFFAAACLMGQKNLLIHDLAKGMPIDFILEFKERLRELKSAGCSILYLSNDVFFAPEIGDRIGFMRKGKLLLELKGAKVRRMDLKELYFRFLAEE